MSVGLPNRSHPERRAVQGPDLERVQRRCPRHHQCWPGLPGPPNRRYRRFVGEPQPPTGAGDGALNSRKHPSITRARGTGTRGRHLARVAGKLRAGYHFLLWTPPPPPTRPLARVRAEPFVYFIFK